MIKLDREMVLLLHQLLVESQGGEPGIRDHNLLDSALENVYQTFDGVDLYPTKEEKGARLGYALIRNHAFVDGNKRIGMLAMLTFFKVNGIKLDYTDDEIARVGWSIANGSMKYAELLEWIKSNKQDK